MRFRRHELDALLNLRRRRVLASCSRAAGAGRAGALTLAARRVARPQPMKAVLASSNAGKLRELAAILAPLGYELVTQSSLGIDTPPETGVTALRRERVAESAPCRAPLRSARARG